MLGMTLVTLVLVAVLVPSSLSQYKIVRHNPFASLTPTLAEYTVDGEDGEVLNLACPGETRIVITAASYQPASNFSSCHLSSPLLQVQASCQRRPSCSLEVSPASLASSSSTPDPCPSLRRLARVSYHCRPAVFRSAVTCLSNQDPLLFLSCPEVEQRILVFSAAFKGAGQGAVYCARPGKDAAPGLVDWRDGAAEGRLRACEEESVTQPLVEACHGQANCSLSVLPLSLGAPSCSSLHVYIKTTFACVPKQVIRPQFVDRDTKPTITSTITTTTTTTTTTTATTTTTSTTKSTKATTRARSLITTTRSSILWSESTSMDSKSLESAGTAPHWSVLSNDLNLDILPLEQERREESSHPGLAILIVVGASLSLLLLALLLLVGLRQMRARQIPSPSPSHHQLPPSLLPEPSLFPTSPIPPPSLFSSTGPIYSTVGRPRTLRPSSAPSPLPPELRLGWPPLDQESTLPRTLAHELNTLPPGRQRQETGTLGRPRGNLSLGVQSQGAQSLVGSQTVGSQRLVEKISVATIPSQDWPFHPQL